MALKNQVQACMDRVKRMRKQIERRGPDSSGMWCKTDRTHGKRLILGHHRLAILDLSEAGHQPMVSQDGSVAIVFNGIIYNWLSLRQELLRRGHSFRGTGDTEALINGWLEWGMGLFPRLDGVFAMAIWDEGTQSLSLVRDRLGIKPLYYQCNERYFRFSSNIQGLLASGDASLELNPRALTYQFSLHAVVPPPDTVLRDIMKLEPGRCLVVGADGHRQKRKWWGFKAKKEPTKSLRESRELIWELLVDAVRKRFDASDIPVGVLLSGGLDSSLILAILCELGRKVRSYSIGFDDHQHEAGSEFYYSDQVVERYQTEHHRWMVSDKDLINRIPEVVRQMTEPMVAQDCVGFYLLAEKVSEDVRVALSGQGADEVFGGYFWYPEMDAEPGNDWQRFSKHYIDINSNEYEDLIDNQYFIKPNIECYFDSEMKVARTVCGDDFINRVLHFDATTLITEDPVKRVDNMCLSFGLEARVPFLDPELVDSCLSIPSAHKLAGGGKGILRDLAKKWLPADIINRNKGYFPVPALKYVRGDFLELIRDTLSSPTCRSRGLYRPQTISRLLANPNAESTYTRLRGNRLWHYALFEMWLQKMNEIIVQSRRAH